MGGIEPNSFTVPVGKDNFDGQTATKYLWILAKALYSGSLFTPLSKKMADHCGIIPFLNHNFDGQTILGDSR